VNILFGKKEATIKYIWHFLNR